MSRPAKSADLGAKHYTLEEKKARLEAEKNIKGESDKIKPSNDLNERQKEIFNYIVEELSSSKILGNLDIFILNKTAICIERLEKIENTINNDDSKILDSKIRATQELYSKDFFRCCNELCLSPQSRAKLAINNIPKGNTNNKLIDILGENK